MAPKGTKYKRTKIESLNVANREKKRFEQKRNEGDAETTEMALTHSAYRFISHFKA